MARNAPPFVLDGSFIGLRRDVHPSDIGPSFCEQVNNVVFRKGHIERRFGMAFIAGDVSKTCPWITAIEHIIYQNADLAAVNYLFGVLSGFETGGFGQIVRLAGFDDVGVLSLTVLANPNNVPVPWARAHFARFDDWILVGGILDYHTSTLAGSDAERTRMAAFKLRGGPVRELGMAPPTAGSFVGRNWQGAFAAPWNLRTGAAPQYRVHYYDEPNNIESDAETSPDFTEIRATVIDALNVWPGVGFNVAFSTQLDRPNFQDKFDQATIIRLQSKSDKDIWMYGNVLSDDGTNIVMTSIAENDPPVGLGFDLQITLQPYPDATRQRVFVKNPPAGHPATAIRVYRRDIDNEIFNFVDQVDLADLTDLGNGWSYYTDNVKTDDLDYSRTSPLYNQQPFGSDAVFNHQDIALFLGVSGKPRNRVYISQPRNFEEIDGATVSQTGAHYLRSDAFVSLPLDPNELQHLAGCSFRGEAIVFTHDGAYALAGVFAVDETGSLNIAIRKLDGVHGALNQNLVLVHDNILYHYDAGGLWAYDGASDTKVSAAIEDYRPDAPNPGSVSGRGVIVEKRVNTDYWHLHRHHDARHDWLIMLCAEAIEGDGLTENFPSGTTDTTIAVATGPATFTVTLSAGVRLRVGDRVHVTNGTTKAIIGECTAFDGLTNEATIIVKQIVGTGNLTGTSNVNILPPMPNRAYIFNLDPAGAPYYGGGWTLFKQSLWAVCSTINANLDSVLIFAGSSEDMGGSLDQVTAIYGYGRTALGERLGAVLSDPIANCDYEAILGSPQLGDMRHPLRFFDITFQFDDDVNVPDAAGPTTQWNEGDLLVGFIHGNRRFNEGPSPLGSAPLIGCLPPTSPRFTLRLRCANYRGAPLITNDADLEAS